MEAKRTRFIRIDMSEERAQSLVTFLQSEARRRYGEFARTQIMECWKCTEVCEELLQALQTIHVEACDHI